MSVTRQEVLQMIEEAVQKSLGRLRGSGNSFLSLKESREQREAEEARLRETAKIEKRLRKAEKHDRRAATDVFESLMGDRKAGKLAARGREFRG